MKIINLSENMTEQEYQAKKDEAYDRYYEYIMDSLLQYYCQVGILTQSVSRDTPTQNMILDWPTHNMKQLKMLGSTTIDTHKAIMPILKKLSAQLAVYEDNYLLPVDDYNMFYKTFAENENRIQAVLLSGNPKDIKLSEIIIHYENMIGFLKARTLHMDSGMDDEMERFEFDMYLQRYYPELIEFRSKNT